MLQSPSIVDIFESNNVWVVVCRIATIAFYINWSAERQPFQRHLILQSCMRLRPGTDQNSTIASRGSLRYCNLAVPVVMIIGRYGTHCPLFDRWTIVSRISHLSIGSRGK